MKIKLKNIVTNWLNYQIISSYNEIYINAITSAN